MDVKTTFLHGYLEEEIYMKQPEGFAVKGKKELVCRLKNSMYGLKQSPRMWYQRFDTYILGLGFTRRKTNHCVYFKLVGEHLIYLVLYEISLIRLIMIFATVLMLWRADLIHWGFLDVF